MERKIKVNPNPVVHLTESRMLIDIANAAQYIRLYMTQRINYRQATVRIYR